MLLCCVLLDLHALYRQVASAMKNEKNHPHTPQKSSQKSNLETVAAVWRILPKKYQSQTFVVLALTLLGTLLETVGIGLVIPVIALMADEKIVNNYPALQPIVVALGNPSQAQLVIYGVSFFLSVYVIKALYLAFLSWKQAQYVYGIKAHLSALLFEKYLRSPYDFHLQQNSGHLIRNLTVEVQELVVRVLNPAVLLTAELTVMSAIALMLFVIEPFGATMLIAVMSVAMYVFQRITKRHLQTWGGERQRHEGYRIQKAQEGLGGAKDVKLLGREADFIANYSLHNLNASLVERKQNALSQIPRLWLETIGVMGLTILVIIALQNTETPASVIPTIGLFAAAAFRILPSANRVLDSIQALRYANVVVNLMLKELATDKKEGIAHDNVITFNYNIELRNVSYVYPSAKAAAISDACLSINKSESIGIIGASGAGKSTLIDLILGLLKPTSGVIYADGVDIATGMRSWQDKIGYVQQSIFLSDDTLKRNIAFGLKDEDIDDELIKQAIKAAQLEQFLETLPNGVDTFVGERGIRLSGGQRQRIGIARALYHNPPVLVFDEATSALDNETELEVMGAIKALKGKRTMIIIAHRLSTIEHCDKVYRLDNGYVVH
jgi:ABC-type multidrug transport system fused ATPase/permease subunit